MDLVRLFHALMMDSSCIIAVQVGILSFIYLVSFWYHSGVVLSLLDSLSVPFCEGLPVQLVFSFMGDQGVG